MEYKKHPKQQDDEFYKKTRISVLNYIKTVTKDFIPKLLSEGGMFISMNHDTGDSKGKEMTKKIFLDHNKKILGANDPDFLGIEKAFNKYPNCVFVNFENIKDETRFATIFLFDPQEFAENSPRITPLAEIASISMLSF